MSDLTAKQELFCAEYLVDLNATQAAIRAGYSEASASAIGAENLRKPLIAERVAKMFAKRSERTTITADKVLREMAIVAFSDHSEYKITDGGSAEMKGDAPPEAIRAVASVRVKVRSGPGGDERETELKLWDKPTALRSLMKHLGVDGVEKVEHAGAVGGRFTLENAREELARVLAKKSKAKKKPAQAKAPIQPRAKK